MDGEIQQDISQCRRHVQLLTDLNDTEAARTWFKELCHMLTALLDHVRSTLEDNRCKKLPICFTQIMTYLSLLIPVCSSQDFDETIDVRRYVQKQLMLCLCQVEEGPASASSDENFTNQMDSSLDKLDLIDLSEGRTEVLRKYENARRQIEQALSHAMSIAHVAYPQDFQIVKGGCKSVLNALDSLRQELQSANLNVAMCNLSIDSCYDKLCDLERRVNAAVLTLCLKIFPQYGRPLQLLHDECKSRGNDGEIDELIADFDLQVDRIVQIGFFAIASSPDSNGSAKIQSHLTCLEALESELVPSLRAFTFRKSRRNACFIEVLKRHWLSEVEGLKRALYCVIDPFTFGQIALEELKQSTDVVFKRAETNEGALKQNALDPIVNESETLIDVVATSFGCAEPPTEVKKLLGNLKRVLHEVKAAVQILSVENAVNRDGCLRIEKRCKIMLSIIKKLVLSLAESNPKDFTVVNERSQLKTEKSTTENIQRDKDDDDKFLNHIISKGREILKERSMLRRTPMKVTFFGGLNKTPGLAANKRNFHFSYSKVRDGSSIDLQLTEILGGITMSFNQIASSPTDK